MKRVSRIIVAAVLLLVLLLIGRCTWRRFTGATDEKKEGPTALVEVAAITRKTITEKLTAYGSVIAQPGKTHSVTVGFETRVRHVLVAPGQLVHESDPLVEVEGSPAAQLQLRQAQNNAEITARDLKHAQERFNLKLATNQELSTAEKAARDAQAQLEALQRAGAGGDNRIRSDMTAVVAKINAQDGQIVPVGSPLVELVAEEEIEVKLGVEAEDLSALQPEQAIAIFPVNNPEQAEVKAKVRLITRRIDPTTRLVDVYVALPQGTKLLLDGFVRGDFERTAENALVVPRSAVLPEEEGGGFQIFTVEKDHAKKHTVKLGVQNEKEVQIITPDLKENDRVVTVGNYELQDGMAVEVPKAK
jgi:membrane fusion protein (multidrug efflux system)